jgi:outer membrane protein, heavy metal efflux system
MASCIRRACVSDWMRRETWIPLFLVALAAVITSFVSTKVQGQAVTPPPRANGAPGHDELVRSGIRPLDGLTLSQAVERFLKENLELKALRLELPMAQADVEDAGQPPQANFLIEAGATGMRTRLVQPRELVPRGWVDIWVARAVKRVREAQYEDAVRTRVANLYTAYVGLCVAQNSVQLNETGLAWLEQLLKLQLNLQQTGQVSEADVLRIKTQREISASALEESRTELEKARLNLANLLNLADALAAQTKVSEDLAGTTSRPRNLPPTEELIRIALGQRPDLKAYRLGVERAQLDRLKTLIEPLNQVQFRLWPELTAGAGTRKQGNALSGSMSSYIAFPTAVLNQGKLKRASINVEQARAELANVERAVVLEVRQARLEYDQARSAFDRVQNEIIPNTRSIRDALYRRYIGGEASAADYLVSQREFNDGISQYLTASIRLRRSALAINTATGESIMP